MRFIGLKAERAIYEFPATFEREWTGITVDLNTRRLSTIVHIYPWVGEFPNENTYLLASTMTLSRRMI